MHGGQSAGENATSLYSDWEAIKENKIPVWRQAGKVGLGSLRREGRRHEGGMEQLACPRAASGILN